MKMLPAVRLKKLNIFSCKYCSYVTQEKFAIEQHEPLCYRKYALSEEELLNCDLSSYNQSKNLQNHLKTEMLECVFCGGTFQNNDLMKSHLVNCHLSQAENAQCCVCALRFDKRIILILHLSTAHGLDKNAAKKLVDEQFGDTQAEKVVDDPLTTTKLSSQRRELTESGVCDEEKVNKEFDLEEFPGNAELITNLIIKQFSSELKGSQVCNQELTTGDLDLEEEAPFQSDSSVHGSGTKDSSDDDFFPEEENSPGYGSESEQDVKKVFTTGKINFDEDGKSNLTITPRKQKSVQCRKCDFIFEGSEVIEHLKKVHERERECFVCQKSFTEVRTVRRHINVIHLGQRATKSLPLAAKAFQGKRVLSDYEFVPRKEKNLVNGLDKEVDVKIFQRANCNESQSGSDDEEAHENLNLVEQLECRKCHLVFVKGSEVVQHLKKVHKTEKECFLCEKSFTRSIGMRGHLESIHLDRPNREDPLVSCTRCQRTFRSMPLLKSHLKSAHGTEDLEIGCWQCHKQFTNPKTFVEHMKTDHGRRILQCELNNCNSVWSLQTTLNRHQRVEHRIFNGEQSLEVDPNPSDNIGQELNPDSVASSKCVICDIIIPETRLLSHNRDVHTAEINVQCLICQKIFPNRHRLRSHKSKAHSEAQHQCDQCGKIFKQERSLRDHLKEIHLGEVRHVCERCGKKFRRRDHMIIHFNKAHLKIRKFQCDQCDHKTYDHRSMIQHKLKHHEGDTQIKYTCDVCGKAFNSLSGFNKHNKVVHEGVRVKCPVCSKEFGVEQSMMRHIQTVHKKLQPHQCPVCNQRFGIKSSMVRHMKSNHGDKVKLKTPRKSD